MSNQVKLSSKFLSQFKDFPEGMNALGRFVYLRTYSRYGEGGKKRRETWKETVKRSIEYNINLQIRHCEKYSIPYDIKALKKEAEELFESVYLTKQFPSGRMLWVGGGESGVADKYPLANFNCSFLNIRSWSDLSELFYLLLVGTGVGFKCTKKMAAGLKPIRTDINIIHKEYKPLPKEQRIENTRLINLENGFVKIYIGDSKEGWVEALKLYFEILSLEKEEYEPIHTIVFSYNSIRPLGEKLKTFGGTASGPQPMKDMFIGIDKVLKNQMEIDLEPLVESGRGTKYVRPIHILDIGNLIGNNVVVGGVRRTAEIFLFDVDDYESMFSKFLLNGIYSDKQFEDILYVIRQLDSKQIPYPKKRVEEAIKSYKEKGIYYGSQLHHRRMSNNSIAFIDKPSAEYLDLVFDIMKLEGEPGFINLYEAARRRLKAQGIVDPSDELIRSVAEEIGLNPCAEILLWSYGVCNLSTVDITKFVKVRKDGSYYLDIDNLLKAQRLSARIGLRMTLVDLELQHWDTTQKRDRLVGTSLTGFYDAIGLIEASAWTEELILGELRRVAKEEVEKYAKELRVVTPLLTTTVKPEGTLSQVAGGVSSGLHRAHSPYFIRRIRINAADPLAKALKEHKGWNMHAEVGTLGYNDPVDLAKPDALAAANTLVVDFPVFSGAKETKDDIDVYKQFETYFRFQRHYTDHNSSNTITLRDNEWAAASEIVYNNWDNFVGVSFLSYFGGSYPLLPYEKCTKEQYEELKDSMQNLDFDVLRKYDNPDLGDLEGLDGCEGGICPIR